MEGKGLLDVIDSHMCGCLCYLAILIMSRRCLFQCVSKAFTVYDLGRLIARRVIYCELWVWPGPCLCVGYMRWRKSRCVLCVCVCVYTYVCVCVQCLSEGEKPGQLLSGLDAVNGGGGGEKQALLD